VLLDVSATIPTMVGRSNGIYIVSNPVQTKENFADRWQRHPHRAERFFDWIAQVQADLSDLSAERGVDSVLGKMAKAFGERAATAAERSAGTNLFDTRTRGALGMSAGTGALVLGAGRTVRPHNFHGDPPQRQP
jgi:hypothetical protein